jgi:hydroxypyruvate isomerase
MTSEWMKVMLDEIARKKQEAEQARLEEQMRNETAGDAAASERVHTEVVVQSPQCARR